jgi:aminoglycoside phosphotransferase (APT) family kinase protein
VRFPGSPDDLDAAWLEEILRRDGGLPHASVRGVRPARIGEGFGLEGVIARVSIVGDRVPATVVAKWCAAADGAREARFYRDVASHLEVDLPRLHAVAVDELSGRALLILEDVSPARQGDLLAGLSASDERALADAMAAVHAPFWDRTSEPPVSGTPVWRPDPAERTAQTSAALPPFLDAWDAFLSPRERNAIEAAPSRLPAAFATLFAAPVTLIHGDLHVDNLLFRPDGTPVVLDWARVSLGPAALDVAGSQIRRRGPGGHRANGRAFALQYAEALRARGVAGYGVDRVEADAAAAAAVQLAGTIRWAARADESKLAIPRVRELVEAGIRVAVDAVAGDAA